MTRPPKILFEVRWLDHNQKVFAISLVRKYDLSAAIKYAGGQIRGGRGNARDAHGFFVRRRKENA